MHEHFVKHRLIGLKPPAAVLMGMPFPVGLRRLAGDHPVDRAWAWAANGFASVVATPLAMLVALKLGSRVLLLLGAAAYGQLRAFAIRSTC